MVTNSVGLGPESDSMAKTSGNSTSKLQTHSLVKEGVPLEENHKCLLVLKIWL
jgi:hypothetical protein